MFRRSKSIEIQAIIARLINIRKTENPDWLELGNYIDTLLIPYNAGCILLVIGLLANISIMDAQAFPEIYDSLSDGCFHPRICMGGTTYSPQGGHHRGIGRAIELPYRALFNIFCGDSNTF